MTEPMQQCDNCLKMFPESKIPTHFGYCRRNIKKCSKCGQMYDINFEEDHQEQFHKKSPCSYCKNDFLASDLKKHVDSCTKKPKYCQYCEQQVPIIEFSSHLRICESRTKPCQKCNKAITNKEYFIHLSTCEGIVQEPKPPKNYNQFIHQNQRKPKEESKKQYTNIVYNPQRKEKREEFVEEKRPEFKREKYQPFKKPEIRQDKPKISYSNKPTSIKNPGSISSNRVPQKPREIVQPSVRPKKNDIIPKVEQKKKKNWQQEYMNDIQFDGNNNFEKFPENNQVFESYNQMKHVNKQIKNLNVNENKYENQGIIDEDEELQKAIMMSMGGKQEKKKELPVQLQNQDLMNTSFYHDVDYEKQKAMMEEFSKKKKR